MKKIIFGLFLLLTIASVSAIDNPNTFVINGYVYENGVPMPSQHIDGTCYSDAACTVFVEEDSDVTGADGHYEVTLQTPCESGHYAKACIHGTDSCSACEQFTGEYPIDARLDIHTGAVPEFGLLAGMLAMIGAIGGLFLLRKR
ncbi:MAG: hypothetical protein KKG59_05340 [Nanoarchaeota archaeon]|nr:hypothetical protein [Nanoarchaeota archaeon]